MKSKSFIAALLLLFCATSLWASDTSVDGIWYDFNSTDLTASVTYSYSDTYDNVYSGSITIPSSVMYNNETYSVTSIGGGAFFGCSDLTSVTIGNSVTSIGEDAFYGCSSLTSVTIPNSVTSIGNSAFYGCSSLTSVTIGNSVTSIGDGAFRYCSSLTSVTLNSDSIVSKTYTYSSNLTSIFGSQVTNYTLGSNVTSIGEYAFYGCSGLTSVTIGNSVTSIGSAAFYGCSSLTSVTIPNSVTSIGSSAFKGCSGLTSVTIGNSVTSIRNAAFQNCSALTSVTIPNSVTSIGNGAFSYCSGLTSVTIGNSVTSIEEYAFYGCSSLTSVTIPNSVTSIGSYAFFYCSNLTSMTMLGETPPTIGNDVFYNINPRSIYVPCGTLDAYKQSWSSYSSKIKYLPLAYTITGEVNDSNAGNVTVPTNVCDQIYATPNYGYHFVQWSDGVTDNPRTIELTHDTTLIAEFAVDKSGSCGINLALTWEYDSDKKILTIGGTGDLTDNKRYGVEANKEMTSLVIEEGVGIIGDSAFANIPTLTTVKIGKDVRKIQDYAFGNCYNLASIYNYRPTPATIVANTFEEVDKYACTLYVLPGSVEMYRSAVGWSDFYNILPIPASAIEEIISENSFTVSPQKIIDNGQLFILLPDGSKYTATGVKVE